MELSGCTRKRLTSAKATMKPSTRIAASRSQRLGSRRRASIETGGRIFMSGRPCGVCDGHHFAKLREGCVTVCRFYCRVRNRCQCAPTSMGLASMHQVSGQPARCLGGGLLVPVAVHHELGLLHEVQG